MSVSPELLGLPADRAWIEPPRAGPYLPSAMLELHAGIRHGVAAPRRTIAFELRGSDGVVARRELTLTVLSPTRPIELSVQLPATPGVEYELALVAGGQVVTWPVRVPEQRLDARWVCETPSVRRGETVHTVLHSGSVGLDTGVAYWFERWNGEAWDVVADPDDQPRAWPAMGLFIRPDARWPTHYEVPRHTTPGRHRVCKRFDAEHAGIGELTLSCEFTVIDD